MEEPAYLMEGCDILPHSSFEGLHADKCLLSGFEIDLNCIVEDKKMKGSVAECRCKVQNGINHPLGARSGFIEQDAKVKIQIESFMCRRTLFWLSFIGFS